MDKLDNQSYPPINTPSATVHVNSDSNTDMNEFPQYESNSAIISHTTATSSRSGSKLRISKPSVTSSTSTKHVHITNQPVDLIIPHDSGSVDSGNTGDEISSMDDTNLLSKSGQTLNEAQNGQETAHQGEKRLLHKSAQQKSLDATAADGGGDFRPISDHPPTPKLLSESAFADGKIPDVDTVLQKQDEMDVEPQLRDAIVKSPAQQHRYMHYHQQNVDSDTGKSSKENHNFNGNKNRLDDVSLSKAHRVVQSDDVDDNATKKTNKRRFGAPDGNPTASNLSWVSERSMLGNPAPSMIKAAISENQRQICNVNSYNRHQEQQQERQQQQEHHCVASTPGSAHTSPLVHCETIEDEHDNDNADSATGHSSAAISVAATTPLIANETSLGLALSPIVTTRSAKRTMVTSHNTPQVTTTKLQHNMTEKPPGPSISATGGPSQRHRGRKLSTSGQTHKLDRVHGEHSAPQSGHIARNSSHRNSIPQNGGALEILYGNSATHQPEKLPHYMTATKSYSHHISEKEEHKQHQQSEKQRGSKTSFENWQPVQIPAEKLPNYMLPTKSYKARVEHSNINRKSTGNDGLFSGLSRHEGGSHTHTILSSTGGPKESKTASPQSEAHSTWKRGRRASDEHFHQPDEYKLAKNDQCEHPLNDGVHDADDTCIDKLQPGQGKVVKLFDKKTTPMQANNVRRHMMTDHDEKYE